MHSISVALTKNYIFYHSTDLHLPETILESKGASHHGFSALIDLLIELNLPKATTLNLYLDSSYISYFHIPLPSIGKRKLDKILFYELEDILIDEPESYYYDYRFHQDKDKNTSVGVFLISKSLLEEFVTFVKQNGLELKSVIPLEDLLDKALRSEYKPNDQIFLTADQYNVCMVIYQAEFATGFLQYSLKNEMTLTEESEEIVLEDLNRKISSIELLNDKICSIRLSEGMTNYLKIDEQNNLSFLPKGTHKVPKSICLNLLEKKQKLNIKPINLLKSNVFIFQELKKHTKRISLFLLLMLISAAIYFTSIYFQNSNNLKHYESLQKTYENTIREYTSIQQPNKDSLNQLTQQVQELRSQLAQNKKYSIRNYRISKQLRDLSLLRKEISSVRLIRYYLTPQSIRIQGEVDTFPEYDKLKLSIGKMFPPDANLRFSQNSIGNKKIEFSVTIRNNY